MPDREAALQGGRTALLGPVSQLFCVVVPLQLTVVYARVQTMIYGVYFRSGHALITLHNAYHPVAKLDLNCSCRCLILIDVLLFQDFLLFAVSLYLCGCNPITDAGAAVLTTSLNPLGH